MISWLYKLIDPMNMFPWKKYKNKYGGDKKSCLKWRVWKVVLIIYIHLGEIIFLICQNTKRKTIVLTSGVNPFDLI